MKTRTVLTLALGMPTFKKVIPSISNKFVKLMSNRRSFRKTEWEFLLIL